MRLRSKAWLLNGKMQLTSSYLKMRNSSSDLRFNIKTSLLILYNWVDFTDCDLKESKIKSREVKRWIIGRVIANLIVTSQELGSYPKM